MDVKGVPMLGALTTKVCVLTKHNECETLWAFYYSLGWDVGTAPL